MRKNGILTGAAFLAAGAFFSKLIGVLYRIPLTRIIGAEGLGLYQMVFPLYVILLDFSGLAFPSVVSKIVSSLKTGESKESVLKSGLKLAAVIGGIGSALLLALAFPLGYAQGNGAAAFGYIAIAPSVILVACISVFRGYFQGVMNMKPTALSQITEQVVKLAAGLTLSYLFMPDLKLALFGATLAVTVSEGVALILLLALYRKSGGARLWLVPSERYAKKIGMLAIPVILTGIALPLSQFIDSFITVNILKTYLSDATVRFGLLSGVALTVINLPISVCYGLSAVSVPSVSGAKSEEEKVKNCKKVIAITLTVTIPCALICYFFAPFIVNILFNSLSRENKAISARLIKILSPSVVFLSLLQTENGVLVGYGRPYLPLCGIIFGTGYKTLLSVIFLKKPSINIFGGAYATTLCYFFAFAVNFIILLTANGKVKKIPAAVNGARA